MSCFSPWQNPPHTSGDSLCQGPFPDQAYGQDWALYSPPAPFQQSFSSQMCPYPFRGCVTDTLGFILGKNWCHWAGLCNVGWALQLVEDSAPAVITITNLKLAWIHIYKKYNKNSQSGILWWTPPEPKQRDKSEFVLFNCYRRGAHTGKTIRGKRIWSLSRELSLS